MIKIISLLLIAGCVSAPSQNLKSNTYYKRDLEISVNKKKGYGTLVVPKESKYRIKIKFPGKGDLVTLKTCHREIESEKLGSKETIDFYPVNGIENNGLCFLEISAFEHKRGRHAWGLIDFESENFKLPAKIKCNGREYNSNGTTICQSKEGLLQVIEFGESVSYSENAKCRMIPFNKDFTKSAFKMPAGECSFIFKGTSGRLHKITLVGYEDIIIKEL